MAMDLTGKDLGDLSTCWNDLDIARRHDHSASCRQAQDRIFRRYERPIKKYLLAAVRDQDVADDLFQIFALRFLKGAFHRASPDRGRFRDYLKTTLFHLVNDFRREGGKLPRTYGDVLPEPPVLPSPSEEDLRFLGLWREELMRHAWAQLANHEAATARPVASILQYFLDNPGARSRDVAEIFAARLRKPITDVWIRKMRRIGRQFLREAIIEEVRRTLNSPSPDRVEEELIDLGLHGICHASPDYQ